MKKITLYIGLNDKDKRYQIIDSMEAQKIVLNFLLANGIDGATIYNAVGIYKHDNGAIITENTLRVELFGVDKESVISAVLGIKTALNQESIILNETSENSDFI